MRHFLVILGITALLWLGVSMSEQRQYPLNLEVEITGFDTVRYAVTYADTALPVQATMSGFNAAAVSLLHFQPHVTLSLDKGQFNRSTAVEDVSDDFVRQLRAIGVTNIISTQDSLRLRLISRGQRTYPVRLDSVDFSFNEQYGLYGEPSVTPATVTLYGPDSLLDAIKTIQVAPAELHDIASSDTYSLPLLNVWKELGDIRSSVNEVQVYLPVEAYVEREYRVPITVAGADSSARIRVYPDQVNVRVWIAKRDLERMPDIQVAIDYADVLAGATKLTPRLIQFPAYIRPRSISPAQVQCVVIK